MNIWKKLKVGIIVIYCIKNQWKTNLCKESKLLKKNLKMKGNCQLLKYKRQKRIIKVNIILINS